MKTGKNKATNNYLIRLWSADHYEHKHGTQHKMFDGTVTNVQTKEVKHFHSIGKMITQLEQMYSKDEKERRSKK